MNIYDMDKTIYNGDSTADFFIHCVFHRPKVLLCIPKMIGAFFKYYIFHIGTKTQFKEKIYTFLKVINTEKEVAAFWEKHLSKIKRFYLHQKREDDIIISASPEFLLKPLEEKLNIRVIASQISPLDGTTLSENCYHEEKVRRLYTEYSDAHVEKFYSDSYSDEPLAKLAESAFIVKGEKIIPWNFEIHKKNIHL